MYIYPIQSFKIIPVENVSKYIHNEFTKLIFNTNEGIYEIANDKIYKHMDTIETTPYDFSNEYKFNIQHDQYIKTEVYYIPINYTYNKCHVKKYKLLPNSLLTLVIEDNIKFYFETKENDITHSVKEDMITFLSLLKLYK